jgi:hypothetical protein
MNPSNAIRANINIAIVQHKHHLSRLRVFLKRTNPRRIYSHIAMWLALLHLLGTHSGSTTIIGVRFDEAVVIVSDSKEINLNNGQSRGVCKIHTGQGFTWAESGMVEEIGGRYNINQTISSVAAKNSTPRRKVDELDKIIPGVIREEGKRMRIINPLMFDRFINMSEILEFLYIGVENEKLVSFFREYRIRLIKGEVSVEQTWKRECPRADCRYPQMMVMGERDEVEAYLVTHPSMYTPSTIEGAIQTGTMLVQMEATAWPTFVSLPIETAVVSTHGVWWSPENTYCKDAEKAPLHKK